MKERCTNPNDKSFYRYGGRGITVCDRWQSFDNFYKDMGEPPTLKHSIDRINVNGDYKPNNCRWATTKEQANNTRSNTYFTIDNRTQSLKMWCDEKGVNYKRVWSRIRQLGWTLEKALTTEKVR